MAGHSRSKNGVLSHAYVPAIHVLLFALPKDVDARHKAGHDDREVVTGHAAYSLSFSAKSTIVLR